MSGPRLSLGLTLLAVLVGTALFQLLSSSHCCSLDGFVGFGEGVSSISLRCFPGGQVENPRVGVYTGSTWINGGSGNLCDFNVSPCGGSSSPRKDEIYTACFF